MAQSIKVNINLDDGGTLGDININDGMSLSVSDLVETGTMILTPGDTHVFLGYDSTTTDPPYNVTGSFILIKNKSSNYTSFITVDLWISSAEATGGGTYLKMQKLYGGEFTWLNIASPNASGTTEPRAVRISNGSTDDTNIDYAYFGRLMI